MCFLYILHELNLIIKVVYNVNNQQLNRDISKKEKGINVLEFLGSIKETFEKILGIPVC
jgi:hypothetical protein